MKANLITTPIAAADVAKALELLGQLRTLLQPVLISLTPNERQAMPKMGDKSLAFVTSAAKYGASLKSLLPAYVDTDALTVDAGVAAALLPLFQTRNSLTLDMDSTLMQAGSEAYANSLLVYAGL